MEKLIKGLPVKEYVRQWRLDNLEKFKATQKKWKSENPEKCREASKRWQEKYPEKLKEAQKAYRLRKKLEEQNNKTKE